MKKLILILLLAVISSCKAQSPIINILEWNGETPTNCYLKDISNDINTFTGTYLFDDGTTYFKVQLKKVPMAYTGSYYEDLLVGEVEYRVNGVTLLNTLPMFNMYDEEPFKHKIQGFSVLKNTDRPYCTECFPNEKRMRVTLNDTKRTFSLVIRKMIIGGNEALKFSLICTAEMKNYGEPTTEPIIYPTDYILIKQF
jgi:hypothetical protein